MWGRAAARLPSALAVNAPEASIYAIDVSQDALDVAAQNVWRYALGEQIQLIPGNLVDPLPEPVDVIVANLPYVASGDLPGLAPDIRDFEPSLALDGGAEACRRFPRAVRGSGSPAGVGKLRPGRAPLPRDRRQPGRGVRLLAHWRSPAPTVIVLRLRRLTDRRWW